MKLMVLILHPVEKLEPVLEKLERAGVRGATVLSSRGMAMALENYTDGSFLGSLRSVLDPDREENRTILAVFPDDHVQKAVDAIEAVVGSLNNPNTGVVFTVPVDFAKGIQS